jgi:hypothetical protein
MKHVFGDMIENSTIQLNISIIFSLIINMVCLFALFGMLFLIYVILNILIMGILYLLNREMLNEKGLTFILMLFSISYIFNTILYINCIIIFINNIRNKSNQDREVDQLEEE